MSVASWNLQNYISHGKCESCGVREDMASGEPDGSWVDPIHCFASKPLGKENEGILSQLISYPLGN